MDSSYTQAITWLSAIVMLLYMNGRRRGKMLP